MNHPAPRPNMTHDEFTMMLTEYARLVQIQVQKDLNLL